MFIQTTNTVTEVLVYPFVSRAQRVLLTFKIRTMHSKCTSKGWNPIILNTESESNVSYITNDAVIPDCRDL